MKEFGLENKLAFILGGSGLIGSSVSRLLTKAGAKVLILDNDKQSSLKVLDNIKKIESGSGYYNFDCAKLDSVEKNLKKIISKFSIPDVFINCSYPKSKDWAKNSFKKITLNSFRENIDIHLNSYSWIAKYIADQMVTSKIKGSIILVSSIYGQKAQDPTLYEGTTIEENMTYPVIKSGIIHLAKQMSSFYGKYQVRINTVCPGGLKGMVAGKNTQQDKRFIKKYIKKIPLGRMTNPEDVAYAILFLASEASSYITGQALNVDGGLSVR